MSWYSRLKNTISPKKLDEELAEEMRDHLLRRSEELEGRGVAAGEARRFAALRFGNLTRIREESRDFRLMPTLDRTLQDLRYALRTFRKSPGFAVTAVASLALAIAANTAIYSIVDAAILRPLPVPHPERLIRLASPEIGETGGGGHEERTSFSYPVFVRFQANAGPVARLALFSFISYPEVRLEKGEAPEKAETQYVSGDAFDILGVPPAIGRLFSPDNFSPDNNEHPGGNPIAVLSYDYWQRRFAGDGTVLGRVLEIEGRSFQVVGVARRGFFGIQPGKFVDI